MLTETCPYCGAGVHLSDGVEVYGTARYGNLYVCDRYPECRAYVGCHPHSKRALGTLADDELRAWRGLVHAAFDPLWRKGGPLTRREAYRRLQAEMGMEPQECHIAMFGIGECRRAIDAVARIREVDHDAR